MRRAALWLWLCALALRLQPALPQTVTTNVPPEDQDGSGDDSDNFSGSGAGALPDTMLHRIPSGKDMQLRTTAPTDSGATSTETVAASILPSVEGPKERGTVYPIELEPGLTVQEETSHPPSETTQHPTTHRASTARASTTQAPATTQPHRDVHPGHHETSAPVGHGHVNPPAPGLEEGGPSVTERTTENGDSSQPSVGDGSGEEDFVFEAPDTGVTGAVEPDSRNQAPGSDQAPQDDGATGASQGLLDRKEVLGGVIAGGLVGLIFAICLVGFMLYRMKKKDEGSYSLEEPKQANGGAYQKPTKQEEFYA